MATSAQSIANQANSHLSTGPRTVEGKARVSQNALRHGLTAKYLVVREDEAEEFAVFQESLAAELDPQGPSEAITFKELLHAAWNLHRFRRIEAEASKGSIEDFTDPGATAVLDRLGRYQARAQRAYYRAIQELRTLQTNRALRALKLTVDEAAKVPAITDINELTKQSQSEVTAKSLEMALQMVDYETATLQANSLRNRAAGPVVPVNRSSLALRL